MPEPIKGKGATNGAANGADWFAANPPPVQDWFTLNAPGSKGPPKSGPSDLSAVPGMAKSAAQFALPMIGATGVTLLAGPEAAIPTYMGLAGLGGMVGKGISEAIVPDVESTPDKFKEVAKEGLYDALGEGGGRLAGKVFAATVGKKFSPNSLFSSAVKPNSRVPGRPLSLTDLNKLADTAAEHGITASEKGGEKVSRLREGVHAQTLNRINNAPSSLFPISRDQILKRLDDVRRDFANPLSKAMTEDDAKVIDKVEEEFKRKPAYFTPQQTQTMKSGTYGDLRGKYGKVGSAQIESEKALARGMREELVARMPELKALGEKESDLIKLEDQIQRFLARERNKNVTGLIPATLLGGVGGGIGFHFGGGEGAAGGLASGVAVGKALALALDNPEIKSTLGNLLRKAARTGAGRAAQKIAPWIPPAGVRGLVDLGRLPQDKDGGGGE